MVLEVELYGIIMLLVFQEVVELPYNKNPPWRVASSTFIFL